MYVALGTGGFVLGFLVGNSMAKTTLEKLVGRAFQEGIVLGYELAGNPEVLVEDYEKEITR